MYTKMVTRNLSMKATPEFPGYWRVLGPLIRIEYNYNH
jgi:hypothetical protein